MIARRAVGYHHAEQKICELAELLTLLSRERLERILEIGSRRGGMLWALRQIAPDAMIVSVDSEHGPLSRQHGRLAKTITGDSHDPETFERVRDQFGKRIDLLFIDGDHTAWGVRRDFDMYGPLVRKGGLIGLHDTAQFVDSPDCGTAKFWEEIRAGAEMTIEIRAPRHPGDEHWAGIGLVRVR